jgi:hypothetical protein
MRNPLIAADGFTYEAEFMKGWLDRGRDTSPMTKSRLAHRHLTPNHALPYSRNISSGSSRGNSYNRHHTWFNKT